MRKIILGALTIFAVMVSWFFNKSILWASLHGVFSIFYLVYCILMGRFADGGFMEIMHYYF